MHFAFLKILLPLGFIALAYGKPDKVQVDEPTSTTTLLTLGEIDSETGNDLSVITIRLDQTPEWKALGPIQNHGAFFQIILPGTIVPEPGKFYDLGKPYLAKIGVFQVSPSDAAIRLFSSPEYNSSELIKAIKTELLGTRILITFDHRSIESSKTTEQVPTEYGPPHITKKLSAEDVIAKTKVRDDLPAPAEMVRLTNPHSSSSVRGYLSKFAIVGAFLTSLILISIGIRSSLRKKTDALKNLDGAVTLKTLASMALAPRQKISVIQVGNEKILLGLTPDSITFLTSLSQDQNKNLTARALHQSLPHLPVDPAPKQKNQRISNQRPKALNGSVGFSEIIGDMGDSPSQKELPRLKKLAGNDEATLRTRQDQLPAPKLDMTTPKGLREKSRTTGNQINIAVGEDGIKEMPRRKPVTTSKNSASPPQETIDDVTRLIREKLKNFKSI